MSCHESIDCFYVFPLTARLYKNIKQYYLQIAVLNDKFQSLDKDLIVENQIK